MSWPSEAHAVQVLQRRRFRDAALRAAGVVAFVEYVAWYLNGKQVYVHAPSALDMPSLRQAFLVPSQHDAIASMAHTLTMSTPHKLEQQATLSTALSGGLSSPLVLRPKPIQLEDDVPPALLENAIAAEEAVRSWGRIRHSRLALERELDVLLWNYCSVQEQLRTLPMHAHAVRIPLH
jgi:hypothetical protein